MFKCLLFLFLGSLLPLLFGCGDSFEQDVAGGKFQSTDASRFSSPVKIEIERGSFEPREDSVAITIHPASEQITVGDDAVSPLDEFLRQHNLSPESPREAELIHPFEDHHQVHFFRVTDMARNSDGSLTVSAHIDRERELSGGEDSLPLAQASGPVVLVVKVVEKVSGVPQIGASVTLGSSDGGGSDTMTALTDTQGMATFAAFSSSGSVTYRVQASEDGFATQTKEVTVFPGQPRQLEFEMTDGNEQQTVDGGSLVLQ